MIEKLLPHPPFHEKGRVLCKLAYVPLVGDFGRKEQ